MPQIKLRHKQTNSRFSLLATMLIIACGYFALTRLALFIVSFPLVDPTASVFFELTAIGLIYDLAFFAFASIPFVLYISFLPNKAWTSRFNRALVHIVSFLILYAIGFVALAEWFFWDEFTVRFNFIAVDYLVYSREVTNNIIESYPLVRLLIGLLLLSTLLYITLLRPRLNHALNVVEPFNKRTRLATILLLAPVMFFFLLGQSTRSFSDNNYLNELASNGPYQFFAAFRNNELDYNTFYSTLPDDQASNLLKQNVFRKTDHLRLSNKPYSLARSIINPAGEKPLNVVLIMVESLSAKYLGKFGNTEGLTPNLDRLSEQSLFFNQFYATGTRTTRGLEAVTLSIPPTPGRSIVKRLGRETGMWSLGNVLKTQGYNTQFIYGGDGYFDNMNAFFSGNGYTVIDKSNIPDDQVIFSNAWGVSDEDLFNTTLNQADKANTQGSPFFFHLMTTSNHRPYSYPAGRIDIASGSGRNGAVKYTDWAIGSFIEQAKTKPWFNNTVFVIVADHCAGSAGKTALPLDKYHIPLLIYAPAQIQSKTVNTLSSQIDLAPTILSILNVSYDSFAFGNDILSMQKSDERALIGNYQHLGLYANHRLSILSLRKAMSIVQYGQEQGVTNVRSINEADEQTKRNIAYYQGASYIYQNRLNTYPLLGTQDAN